MCSGTMRQSLPQIVTPNLSARRGKLSLVTNFTVYSSTFSTDANTVL